MLFSAHLQAVCSCAPQSATRQRPSLPEMAAHCTLSKPCRWQPLSLPYRCCESQRVAACNSQCYMLPQIVHTMSDQITQDSMPAYFILSCSLWTAR